MDIMAAVMAAIGSRDPAAGGGRNWTAIFAKVAMIATFLMIVAGGLIVFMFGLHEVTMSSLLYGPGSATLAVVVLNLQQLGDNGLTAALALVLAMLVALAAVPIAGRAGARTGTGRLAVNPGAAVRGPGR